MCIEKSRVQMKKNAGTDYKKTCKTRVQGSAVKDVAEVHSLRYGGSDQAWPSAVGFERWW